MEGGVNKWRIDTLDGRGGLAFASSRASDLEDGTALLDRPVFHFSPPSFTPIPVASPATALAAERHGFQFGLFDEEGEVPFDNLADVAEFVRRAYVASGRSDGTDGGGVPPVPPPTGEPPDLVPEGGAGEIADPLLQTRVVAFQTAVQGTARGLSKSVSWNLEHDCELSKLSSRSSLVLLGAGLTLVEMLARFPRRGGESELQTWQAAAFRLVATLIRIGVPSFADNDLDRVVPSACRNFLHSARGSLIDYRNDLVEMANTYPVWATLCLMSGCHPEYWWRSHAGLYWSASSEPLDDLAHFPVNKQHAKAISAPDPGRASVADLLSSCLASPAQIAKVPNLDAVTAFGAARIVAFDGAPWGNVSHAMSRNRATARLALLTVKAYKWLDQELPRLNFSPSVEGLLEMPAAAPTALSSSPQGLAAIS